MSDALLAVEGVTVRFGGLTAVDSMSVVVRSGTIHGIIGPNGAGKTTFFDTISGHRRASAGRVEFRGRDVTREPAHRRARMGLARTFQLGGIIPDLTALENVVLGLDQARRSEVASTDRRSDHAVALATLERFGVGGAADQPCVNLAAGTRRLVEVARTIAAGAHLVLLDEPGAGVHETESRELVRVIRALAGEGTAFLLTDHSMDLVFAACDDVTVMNFGKRIANGPPEAIRNDPEVLEAYLGTAAMRHA